MDTEMIFCLSSSNCGLPNFGVVSAITFPLLFNSRFDMGQVLLLGSHDRARPAHAAPRDRLFGGVAVMLYHVRGDVSSRAAETSFAVYRYSAPLLLTNLEKGLI